ncbi:hypothetical protein J6590_034167 [Homalodisca vitripennis]|nr:hypothetical protein J6590_034167 [Homalodisca vitripennis]
MNTLWLNGVYLHYRTHNNQGVVKAALFLNSSQKLPEVRRYSGLRAPKDRELPEGKKGLRLPKAETWLRTGPTKGRGVLKLEPIRARGLKVLETEMSGWNFQECLIETRARERPGPVRGQEVAKDGISRILE